MAWTYSGDPSLSNKDAVRFLTGDTQSDSPLSTDEEIEWSLSINNNNIYRSAADIAEGIAAYFATQAETTVIGPIREENGRRAELYAKKAAELKRKAQEKGSITFYAGGLSVSEKIASQSDSDSVQPAFYVGMGEEDYQ